jgi:hypothetical protein
MSVLWVTHGLIWRADSRNLTPNPHTIFQQPESGSKFSVSRTQPNAVRRYAESCPKTAHGASVHDTRYGALHLSRLKDQGDEYTLLSYTHALRRHWDNCRRLSHIQFSPWCHFITSSEKKHNSIIAYKVTISFPSILNDADPFKSIFISYNFGRFGCCSHFRHKHRL